MRQSRDEYRDGRVYNGYDYTLQVWVNHGRIVPCGHNHQASEGHITCNGFQLANMDILTLTIPCDERPVRYGLKKEGAR